MISCLQLLFGFNFFKVIFLSTNNVKVISNRVACKVSAILIHFCVLSSFFWTSVMAWDIYKTFGRRNIFSRVRPRKYFLRYCSIAFGSSGAIVCIALTIEFSGMIPGFEVLNVFEQYTARIASNVVVFFRWDMENTTAGSGAKWAASSSSPSRWPWSS